jgi:NAD(P)-dependent dehydrogenase (short-subunit alcohol dehydrogenase family)
VPCASLSELLACLHLHAAAPPGIFPMTAGPYYAAAKAGVVHFVRSLAPRLAPHGIQLTAVCPQYVDTPLVRNRAMLLAVLLP